MKLKKEHQEILRNESQISPELAELFELRSSKKGIEFSYLNFDGVQIASRTKLVPAVVNKESGKRIRYLQGKGEEVTCYFCREDIEKIKDPAIPLFITEGEKKAICLKGVKGLRDKPVVSYPGCWNWGRKNKNGELGLSDMWSKIPLYLRDVFWLPDTDFYSNHHSHNGMMKFCSELQKRGAKVHLVDLRGGKHGCR